MRPGYQRVRCVECGVDRADALDGFISTRGKCKVCGLKAQLENVAGIEYGQGVPYQRWRIGIIASLLPTEIVRVLWDAGVFTVEPAPVFDESRHAA